MGISALARRLAPLGPVATFQASPPPAARTLTCNTAMLMRYLTALPLLAFTLVACSDKAADTTTDSLPQPTAAAAMPVETNPHVMGFDSGHGLDSLGHILGGVDIRFTPADTIFVSVRAQYVEAGAKIEAVLLRGTARVATDQGVTGAADPANGVAIVPIRFAKSTPWATGSHQVEVFLNGVSQGLRPIEIK